MARMRAQERRQQLLEVAAELFASRGYRGTTTADLAKSAGITEPILYRHFENKHDLFVTLLDEVGREVIAAWESALEGASSPRARLRVLLASNPATSERGRGVYRVIFQAMSEHENDDAIARALRRHMTTLHGFIRDELAALQEGGTVRRDQSATALAWLLVDVAIGFGMVAPVRSVGKSKARTEMQHLLTALVSA